MAVEEKKYSKEYVKGKHLIKCHAIFTNDTKSGFASEVAELIGDTVDDTHSYDDFAFFIQSVMSFNRSDVHGCTCINIGAEYNYTIDIDFDTFYNLVVELHG